MNIKEFNKKMQLFGKSLLFPISLLSFMAIFLGLAAALQNKQIIATFPFLKNEMVQNGLTGVRRLTALPFTYLPLLFAMCIPMGMVKRDREVAVYSALVGYIAMLIGMNYILTLNGIDATTTSVKYLTEQSKLSLQDATFTNALYINELGIFVYRMNVVGGIIAGLAGVAIHNRFRTTELHNAFTFFSGKRFVPIMSAIIMFIVGVGLTFIWPLTNKVIMFAGTSISKTGYFGVFLYGFIEKVINPTGLHHILNQMFRFTPLGGTELVNAKQQVGALNIYLAQLEANVPFSTSATQYLAQGKILHMVFGMPAAVLAIVHTALPEKRKKVMQFFTAGLTAVILTGITEPIEFTFIFISPVLWIINAIFAGLAFLVPALLGVTIGNIQGGVIDWIVFGIFQGIETKWYIYIFFGPIFFAMYYYVYKLIILKFNVPTIGRNKSDLQAVEIDPRDKELAQVQNENDHLLAKLIIDGLGGIDNITDVDNCISRLRVEIEDDSKIDELLIKETNPNGIVRPDKNTVHIVYGGRVVKMRNIVDDYIYNIKGE